MRKLRFVFEKKGLAAHLSHLDVMRTFTRSFHRAEIPLRYTEGFNPHPFISIAHPLSVGVTGDHEILDCDVLQENINLNERLNRFLPEGLVVVSEGEAIRKVSDISFAKYTLTLFYDDRDLSEPASGISSLFEGTEIPVMKRSKRGMVEINLAEHIEHLHIDVVNGGLQLDVIIRADPAPINPRYLIAAIPEVDLAPDFTRYHRVGFLDKDKLLFV